MAGANLQRHCVSVQNPAKRAGIVVACQTERLIAIQAFGRRGKTTTLVDDISWNRTLSSRGCAAQSEIRAAKRSPERPRRRRCSACSQGILESLENLKLCDSLRRSSSGLFYWLLLMFLFDVSYTVQIHTAAPRRYLFSGLPARFRFTWKSILIPLHGK